MTNFETDIRSMGFSREEFKDCIFGKTTLFKDDMVEGIVAVRNEAGGDDTFFWVNRDRFWRFFCSNLSTKNYELAAPLFRVLSKNLENEVFNRNTSKFKSTIDWYRGFLKRMKNYAQNGDIVSLNAMHKWN